MSKKKMNSTPNGSSEPNQKTNSRSEQSRINGAKSKGPITPEGKSKSSKNALSHGLTANVHTVLHFESSAAYTENLDAWVDNLRPADKVELRVVNTIANLQWRLERLALMETSLLNVEMAQSFEDTLANFKYIDDVGALAAAWKASSGKGNGLDLLRRYLATLQNQFNGTFKMFEKLEARRRDPSRLKNAQFEDEYKRPTFDSAIVDDPEPEESIEEPSTTPSEVPSATPETTPFQDEPSGPQPIDSTPKSPASAPPSWAGSPGRKVA